MNAPRWRSMSMLTGCARNRRHAGVAGRSRRAGVHRRHRRKLRAAPRERCAGRLAFLGLWLDPHKNATPAMDTDIAAARFARARAGGPRRGGLGNRARMLADDGRVSRWFCRRCLNVWIATSAGLLSYLGRPPVSLPANRRLVGTLSTAIPAKKTTRAESPQADTSPARKRT